MEEKNMSYSPECKEQKHVHEIVGSTATVGDCRDCHNHRFCTVSGEAIREGKSHVHEFQAASLIDSPLDFKCMD